MSQQQLNERRFPTYSIARLCAYCKLSPSWIEYDHEQKWFVDMNTQHKHVCPSFQYKITNSGYDDELTEDQAIVARLNRNWRSFP